MAEHRWTWRLERSIPSDTASCKCVLDEILSQLCAHAWEERDRFGVHLALEEALVNAVKHGNRLDANKSVHVTCMMSSVCVHVEIRDEGQGFDPELVPDPTRPENLEIPSGRGVLLIKSFMSEVEYNGAGNCVRMVKRRDEEPKLDDAT